MREIRKEWSEQEFVPDDHVTMADREGWPILDSLVIPTTRTLCSDTRFRKRCGTLAGRRFHDVGAAV